MEMLTNVKVVSVAEHGSKGLRSLKILQWGATSSHWQGIQPLHFETVFRSTSVVLYSQGINELRFDV